MYTASPEPSGGHPPANVQQKPQLPPKRHGSNRRKTVEVYGCVSRETAAEIERLRDQGGKKLSRSAVVAALVEKAIQGHIDMQYGALLRPIIETTIRRELQALSNRGANLAVNGFYSAEQARILIIQLLAFVLGDESDILPGLISQAQEEAHKNLRADLLEPREKDEEKS